MLRSEKNLTFERVFSRVTRARAEFAHENLRYFCCLYFVRCTYNPALVMSVVDVRVAREFDFFGRDIQHTHSKNELVLCKLLTLRFHHVYHGHQQQHNGCNQHVLRLDCNKAQYMSLISLLTTAIDASDVSAEAKKSLKEEIALNADSARRIIRPMVAKLVEKAPRRRSGQCFENCDLHVVYNVDK
jgi:hypothetical protein